MDTFNISEIFAWITVVFLIAAIPLTVLYFRNLNKNKSDSYLSKRQSKAPEIVPVDVNFNFDNNWSAESKSTDKSLNVGTERKLAKIIIKTIALNGEMGMLVKQISDILELNEIEVNYSLNYLTDKGFIEAVNNQKGIIHYLTPQGVAYCDKKGYMCEVA
ncbi:MAG: hypothetical protein ACC657_00640 [Thiohalomonadales bacterium]